jgi:hypothetical protein
MQFAVGQRACSAPEAPASGQPTAKSFGLPRFGIERGFICMSPAKANVRLDFGFVPRGMGVPPISEKNFDVKGWLGWRADLREQTRRLFSILLAHGFRQGQSFASAGVVGP